MNFPNCRRQDLSGVEVRRTCYYVQSSRHAACYGCVPVRVTQ